MVTSGVHNSWGELYVPGGVKQVPSHQPHPHATHHAPPRPNTLTHYTTFHTSTNTDPPCRCPHSRQIDCRSWDACSRNCLKKARSIGPTTCQIIRIRFHDSAVGCIQERAIHMFNLCGSEPTANPSQVVPSITTGLPSYCAIVFHCIADLQIICFASGGPHSQNMRCNKSSMHWKATGSQ